MQHTTKFNIAPSKIVVARIIEVVMKSDVHLSYNKSALQSMIGLLMQKHSSWLLWFAYAMDASLHVSYLYIILFNLDSSESLPQRLGTSVLH